MLTSPPLDNQGQPSNWVVAPTVGFAAGVTVWCTWWITHHPWVGLAEQVSLPIILGAWVAALFLGLIRSPAPRVATGLFAGFISAALGLLILGSKLGAPAAADNVSPGLIPSAGLIAAGFLGFGCVLGLAVGVIASFVKTRPEGDSHDWLCRFAWTTVAAAAPLLFVGGLVTSTNAGMAVPDWPNTYGTNMFLYPLGPRVEPAIFHEHSHRLFGTLVGCASMVLMALTLVFGPRGFVRTIAVALFMLIVIQGLVGAARVIFGNTDLPTDLKSVGWIKVVHGVLAQLTLIVAVMLAVRLTKAFRTYDFTDLDIDLKLASRVRGLATGLMHSTILQLVFGAMFRHLRTPHALWAHVGFSIIIVGLAVAVGFVFTSPQAQASRLRSVLRPIGLGLIVVVVLQFGLGWLNFFAGNIESHGAKQMHEALIRTVHQANGALLLGLATMAFVWSRTLGKAARERMATAVRPASV